MSSVAEPPREHRELGSMVYTWQEEKKAENEFMTTAIVADFDTRTVPGVRGSIAVSFSWPRLFRVFPEWAHMPRGITLV